MTPEIRTIIKFVAGTVIMLGLFFGFIERFYGPTYLVTEKPFAPAWVGWVGWSLAAVGSIAYFLSDIFEWWGKRP
jgi:hypothetical protein